MGGTPMHQWWEAPPCTSGGRHPHAPVVGGTPMHQWWEAPPCTSGGRHPHAPVVGGTPMYQWREAPPCTSGGRHPHVPVEGGTPMHQWWEVTILQQLLPSSYPPSWLRVTFWNAACLLPFPTSRMGTRLDDVFIKLA